MRTTVPRTPLEHVLEELALIPRGDLYQNMFRAVYVQRRLHVLGRNARSTPLGSRHWRRRSPSAPTVRELPSFASL